jgi:hypothetical protein
MPYMSAFITFACSYWLVESSGVAGMDAGMCGHSFWRAKYPIADFMTRG